MLIPKSAFIATGDESQEPWDGSKQYTQDTEDPSMVVVDGANLANLTIPESEGQWEPTFESLDEPWLVEDD